MAQRTLGSALEARSVVKRYPVGDGAVVAVDHMSLSVQLGDDLACLADPAACEMVPTDVLGITGL